MKYLEEPSEELGIPIMMGDWWIDSSSAPDILSILKGRVPKEHLEGSKVVISGEKLSGLKLRGVSHGIASYEEEEGKDYSEKGTIYLQSSKDTLHEVGHHVYEAKLTASQRRRVGRLSESSFRRGDLLGVEWDREPSEFFASAYACYVNAKEPVHKGKGRSYYVGLLGTTYRGMVPLLNRVFGR